MLWSCDGYTSGSFTADYVVLSHTWEMLSDVSTKYSELCWCKTAKCQNDVSIYCISLLSQLSRNFSGQYPKDVNCSSDVHYRNQFLMRCMSVGVLCLTTTLRTCAFDVAAYGLHVVQAQHRNVQCCYSTPPTRFWSLGFGAHIYAYLTSNSV